MNRTQQRICPSDYYMQYTNLTRILESTYKSPQNNYKRSKQPIDDSDPRRRDIKLNNPQWHLQRKNPDTNLWPKAPPPLPQLTHCLLHYAPYPGYITCSAPNTSIRDYMPYINTLPTYISFGWGTWWWPIVAEICRFYHLLINIY